MRSIKMKEEINGARVAPRGGKQKQAREGGGVSIDCLCGRSIDGGPCEGP
jgi:hypothetical protein